MFNFRSHSNVFRFIESAIVFAILVSFLTLGANAQDPTPSSGVAPTPEGKASTVVNDSAKQDGDHAEVDAETKALHDKLAKYLSGTKWTGQFTMKGSDKPRTESYEILSAEKGEDGDDWNLVARIKYGDHDTTMPLPPIEIKFAGGTPVITVDRVSFPGFGMFDARVLIRKGQYAGTWAHIGDDGGGVGGHMFGTIEKMTAEELETKTKKLRRNRKKAEPTDSDSDK